jgi:hypothetical protein
MRARSCGTDEPDARTRTGETKWRRFNRIPAFGKLGSFRQLQLLIVIGRLWR